MRSSVLEATESDLHRSRMRKPSLAGITVQAGLVVRWCSRRARKGSVGLLKKGVIVEGLEGDVNVGIGVLGAVVM